ncbi:MAG: methyltransferase domain-containing protein [Desulfobacterales bacterium]
MIDSLRFLANLIPVSARRALVRYTRRPPVGWVRFGDFRRLHPISPQWGSERGKPIDRYYIEQFLAAHSADIRGRVLEIGDDAYTRMFGGSGVIQTDVLHVAENRSNVTIIGDLTDAGHIPSDSFDCIILTQTLQFIYDLRSAIRTLYRILQPGGVVLVTIPGISKSSRYDMERWGYYWSFTTMSVRRLFETAFPTDRVEVRAHGNVLAAVGFLHGLATRELKKEELDFEDPDYELLITLRAVRPE